MLRGAIALVALWLGACSGSSPSGGDAGAGLDGATVQQVPFRLCLGVLCTVAAGVNPPPQPYLYAEGTRPVVNPQTLAAFPAIGWVVGSSRNEMIPSFIWQGNRLSGVDAGTLYEVTELAQREDFADRVELSLRTNYSDQTARLTLRRLSSGALAADLEPPPDMAQAGIAVTVLSFDTPPEEGLFGLGARKDFFNQRGRLRNVWTEQQNTGLGGAEDLDLTGLGRFAGLPLPTTNPLAALLAELGIQQDLDDLLLLEERTSFPNGAQAAYWVEAYVVGARGWAAWTRNMHFQRLDLAATRPDKLRWQVVGSGGVVQLRVADGRAAAAPGESPIEAASRIYTADWGRAPAPGALAFEPWIQTLNQGEGEAAPNGAGFWGGQRARCEIEGFIAKSAQYDLPLRVIGVEGWQVIPQTHPDCLALSTEQICSHPNGFPRNEQQLRAEVAAGTSFFNAVENCPAAGRSFFDSVRERGFALAGYWNFFTTDHGCPDNDPAQCRDDTLGVPLASKQAYAEAFRRELFVKSSARAQPNQTDAAGNHVVTTNRGGRASLIDFTNEAAVPYWQQQLARLLDQGISLFMHDFGELTTDAMRFAAGDDLLQMHNFYAWRYQRAARLALDAHARERVLGAAYRPFFYARAGMTGACAFTPGVFPGDESTSWDAGHGLPSVMPAMLNLALSGCYAFTTDVGGYFDVTTPRTTEELFVRWSQLAALTPVLRIHNSTFNGSVFPWTWVEGGHRDPPRFDTPGIFRRYARLKRNLIPLTVHWAERAATRGDIGPVRPLILHDDSPMAQRVDYQWLYGTDLLVAPVYQPGVGAVEVYFPAGARWQRVTVDELGRLAPTAEIHDGGTRRSVAVDAATLADIPLFLRCGTTDPLLPLQAPADCRAHAVPAAAVGHAGHLAPLRAALAQSDSADRIRGRAVDSDDAALSGPRPEDFSRGALP